MRGIQGMKTTLGRRGRRPRMSDRKGRKTTAVLVLTLLGAFGAEARAQEPLRLMGIETLARQALDANRDLLAAREGLMVAEEQVTEAWSNVYPSIDVSASYTRNISPAVNFLPAIFFDPSAGPDDYIPIQFGADNQWISTVGFEQPLFRAGVFVGVSAAGRFRSFQNEVVRGRAQSVVTQMRATYYQLLLAQEQLRLTENSVDRVRKSLEETRALNRAGLASDYDVLRLEVELANLEPNLRRAQNATLQARRQLAIQVDLDDQESLRVSGTLAEMDLENLGANSAANREILGFMGFRDEGLESVDEALAQAATRRSDILQLELNEDLRRAEMRVEQMAYLPEVTLFGNYIINAQNNGAPSFFASGHGQRAYSRLIGVSVSVPIFQGFRREARIDQRRASLRQAQAQTRQGVDMAASQVRTLVEAADEALQRARGQRLAVTQAGRGFEIASAQYREGLGSQLELTDAEVALRQSEFNYAQAVYDYLSTRARLDEATGLVPTTPRGAGL
jgi:outer membrane protein